MQRWKSTTLISILFIALSSQTVAGQTGTDRGRRPPDQFVGTDSDPANPLNGFRPANKGLFINISTGEHVMDWVFDAVRDDPRITGLQVQVTWAQLEPEMGVYDWSFLDDVLIRAMLIRKKVAIKFSAAGGKVKYDGQGSGFAPTDVYENLATPDWLFDAADADWIGEIATPKGHLPRYPVFWDAVYQARLADFIAALAARYDGDPRIEFIRTGGWQIGTNEPSFYDGATVFLQGALADAGFDVLLNRRGQPILSADDPYAQAVGNILDLWGQAFQKTRLAATVHFAKRRPSFESAMNDRAVAWKMVLLNTGLNEGDHTLARMTFRRWHDQNGCPVGWGGITHLGTRLTPAQVAALPHSLEMEMFLQGLGLDNDPDYAPAAAVSYIVFGPGMLDLGDELDWAADNLIQ